MTDWFDWHRRYDSIDGYQQRLALVQKRIADHLDAAPPGPITLLSICAGQGRDVSGVLARHPRRDDVRGLLVDLDPRNTARAIADLDEVGATGVVVETSDAALASVYRDVVPADIVLACGIFGNVSDADVQACVKSLSMLCAPGATVVWTRHRGEPDLTPTIRTWFEEAGFDEIGFDGVPDGPQSVGANRLRVDPLPFDPTKRFFEFIR